MSLLNEALCMSLCMSVSYKASQWQGHSKKMQSVQVVHVQRDALEIVTLRASPSSVMINLCWGPSDLNLLCTCAETYVKVHVQ